MSSSCLQALPKNENERKGCLTDKKKNLERETISKFELKLFLKLISTERDRKKCGLVDHSLI